MPTLSIDIETYSSVDLTKSGVYPYTEAEDFTILLLAYAFDDGPVQIVDLAGGDLMPDEVYAALLDASVLKTAWNANFERTCLAKYLGRRMFPEQWSCSMVWAMSLGLPGSLEMAAKVLKTPQQKASTGRALIRLFSCPHKASRGALFKTGTRVMPEDQPEKWRDFRDYCIKDVETERSIRNTLARLSPAGLPESERRLWCLDQRINDTGVLVDKSLAGQAIKLSEDQQASLLAEAVELTGLANPKSVSQLKAWLKDVDGVEVESLNKQSVPDIIASTANGKVKLVLDLRQEMSKSSIAKYDAMWRSLCNDGRIRGLFQFYGASRTGRWAGRLVQVQNLPQNHLEDLDLARQLVLEGRGEDIEILFGSISDTLSQLIRTNFIPSPGHKFVVADFSAIEARIIAWLAGEQWRLDVFATHGKIYEASASAMFKVPINEIHKGSPLRQKGKIAELACGYGGGVGALKSMDPKWAATVPEAELKSIVISWRQANLKIVQLWRDVEEAAIEAVMGGTRELDKGLRFSRENGRLLITLPSGRSLSYVRPRIEPEPEFGKDGVTFEGMNQVTKKWERMRTFGGRIVENCVQAIARDCLAEGMLRLAEDGYNLVMHVHDEVVLEVPDESDYLEAVCRRLGEDIAWAPGLLLRADGYECSYYMKD